jgi:hypothetical protein
MSDEDFLNQCIEYFGKDKQQVVAIEEMAELTQQLSKFVIGHPKAKRENLVEEYVDVLIMMNQLRLIYKITDGEVEALKSYKLYRLEKFINDNPKT